jgi:peptidoglycan-associated lipoprotein
MNKYQRTAAAAASAFLLLAAISCTKRTAVLAPPAPPKTEVSEAPKPNPPTIISFAAEPGTVERGQSAALRWVVKDATQVEIDHGVGVVALADERRVSPQDDTIYRLRAVGPGGSADATTTLAVMLPPPPPKVEPPKPTISQRISTEVEDVFFDFDRSDVRSDARTALTRNAVALKEILSDFPTHTVILEGHCDERGSAEYNLGLGDRRGTNTKAFLSELGLPLDRVLVISYGKERPQCTESDEACWQKNRRVHFTAGEDQRKANVPSAE